MTNVDATPGQQVLNLAQRKRISDIYHHRQADDLGQTIEIAEWISHPTRLKNGCVCLKPIWSDIADARPEQSFAGLNALAKAGTGARIR